MNTLQKIIILVFIPFLFSCQDKPDTKTLLLDYKNFGPQAMANEIIGMDWWQWQSHGDSKPRQYDIKVVVYKDAKLTHVEQLFPVDKSQEKDFRYLQYQLAMEYLNKHIDENMMESITEILIKTRTQIETSFEKKTD